MKSVPDARVDDGDEISHGGGDGNDGFFAVLEQAFIDDLEGWVVVSCSHRGPEQSALDLGPSAPLSAIALALVALVQMGGDTGGRCGLATGLNSGNAMRTIMGIVADLRRLPAASCRR